MNLDDATGRSSAGIWIDQHSEDGD